MNKELFYSEVKLVFFLGVVPAFLSYYIGKMDGLKAFVEASSVAKVIFGYFLLAFIIHLVIAAYIKIHAWCSDDAHKRKIKFLTGITGPLSEGLLGIYRVASGILVILPILWKAHEPSGIELYKVIILVFLGLCFFIGTSLISYIIKLATNVSNNLIKSTRESGAT